MSPIIKKEHVTVSSPGQAPARRRGHAKVANLLRVEGEVRAIEVQCTCGEKTVIELEYEECANVGVATAVPEQAPNTPPVAGSEPSIDTGPEEEIPS